jgi:uncharacterized membrane protein
LLIIVSFVLGLLALTRPARATVSWLEGAILSKIPGYTLLKGAGESFLGQERGVRYPLILVRTRESWQFGFLVERLEDGHVAVYLPGAPNPLSGSVMFMSPERIRPCDVPVAAALRCLREMGGGSHALLRELPKP